MASPQDQFAADALAKHNELRALHGAPPLTLSNQLSADADAWAKKIASEGKMTHASNTGQGENLYYSKGFDPTGQAATQKWYDEIKDYDFSKATFSSETGHFTQVVWKNSKQLGVAKARSSDGGNFVVARYSPPGNYIGQFADNVKPLLNSNTNSTSQPKPPVTPPTPAPITTPVNPIPPSPQNANFQKDVLNFVNNARKQLKLTELKWDATLDQFVLDQANLVLKGSNPIATYKTPVDQICVAFDGKIPPISEIFQRIYKDSPPGTPVQKTLATDKANNPIYKSTVKTVTVATVQKDKRLAAVFVFSPGANSTAVINIKQ